MGEGKSKSYLIIKITKYFPQSRLIHFINLLIKLIPIFCSTHDWNTNSKKSISHYIRYLTLATIIHTRNKKTENVYKVIVGILLTLALYLSISFFVLYKRFISHYRQLMEHDKFLIKFYSFCYFYIYVFLSQYIYSIGIEIIQYSELNLSYYIFIVLFVILVIYSGILSFFVNMIIYEPLIIENYSLLSFPMTTYNNFIFLFPIYQIVVQLEMNRKFKETLVIKNIFRGIFCVYYIYSYLSNRYSYISKTFDFILKYFYSACFVSCVIEWISYYDIKNDLVVLVKDKGIISMKLILELLISYILTDFFYKKEGKRIENMIRKFNEKDWKKQKNCEIILLLNLFYYRDDEKLLKSYIDLIHEYNEEKIIKTNVNKKNDSKEPIETNESPIFSTIDFLSQKEKFIHTIKNQRISTNKDISHSFRLDFPLLYNFIKKILCERIERTTFQSNNESYFEGLFSLLTLYYCFERNYFQSFFLIETMKKSKIYKTSAFFKLKVEKLYSHIKTYYNIYLRNASRLYNIDNDKKVQIRKILSTNVKFKLIKDIIIANEVIKVTLSSYINVMTKFTNETEIDFFDYKKVVFNFINEYNKAQNINKKILDEKISDVKDGLSEIDTVKYNYALIRNFFSSINESSNEKKFESDLSKICLNISQLNDYILIIRVENAMNVENGFKFIFSYSSQKFNNLLGYSKEEIKILAFTDIFPKTFAKHYIKLFSDKLKQGITYLQMKDFFLIDKHKYIYKFDLSSTTLFPSDGIRLYIRLHEISILDNYCILTNKLGRIYSISNHVEQIFFLKSIIFSKCRINFDDLFVFNVSSGLSKSDYFLHDIYEQIINYLKDTNNNDISQKIGEDEFSNIIVKITEMISSLKLKKNQPIIRFICKKEELVSNKNVPKNFYCITFQIISPQNKTIVKNLNKFLYSVTQKNSTLTQKPPVSIFNFDKDEIIEMRNQNIKKDLIFRIMFVKRLSLRVLKIFYNIINKDNSEIEKEDNKLLAYNNEEKTKNTNINNNDINENTELLKIDSIDDIISLNLPSISLTMRISILFFSVIFIGCITVLSFFQLKKFKNQKTYMKNFLYYLMYQATTLNLLTNILFLQIKNNGLQSKFFLNSEYEEDTKLKLFDFSSYNLLINKANLEQYSDFSTSFLKDIINKEIIFSVPEMNGTKMNESTTFSSMTEIRRMIDTALRNTSIPLLFNNSNYYFEYNSDENSGNYFVKLVYVVFVDNYISLFVAYTNEYINAYIPLVIEPHIIGKSSNSFGFILVAVLFSVVVIFSVILFLKNDKYLYSKYFIIFNQLLFFHLYIGRKTQYLLEYIETEGNIENEKKKLTNMVSRILLNPNIEENLILERLLKDGQFENINQIRINPFLLETNKPSRKVNFLGKLLLKGAISNISGAPGQSNSSVASLKRVSKNIFSKKKKNSPRKDTKQLPSPNTSKSTSTVSSSTNTLVKNTPTIIFDHNGHKLLNRPNQNLYLEISLPILLISYLVICIIEEKVSATLGSNTKDVIKQEYYLFSTLFMTVQLVQTHLLSLLRNKEVIEEYVPTKYYALCEDAEYTIKNKEHNIFEEIQICFNLYENEFKKAVYGNFNSKFNNLRDLLINFNSEHFCNSVGNLIDELKKKEKKPIYIFQNETGESFILQCKAIGNGFTSKGLVTMIESIYDEIISEHKDFNNDEEKNSENNLMRFNNQNLIIIQESIYIVLNKIPYILMYLSYGDYDSFESKIIMFFTIFICSEIFMIIYVSSHYYKCLLRYRNDENNIDFFTKCVGHTIIF